MRKGKSFRLPKAITVALYKNAEGKCVAHALDFDLVSVADSEQEALKKIGLTVKVYIESLLSKLAERSREGC